MADGLLEAVRGLWLADPDLGPKPLLAKLREQQPDLGAGNKEVREALTVIYAPQTSPFTSLVALGCSPVHRLPRRGCWISMVTLSVKRQE